MEIRFCPECRDEVVDAGLAAWPGLDAPVRVVTCASLDCGWCGVDEELVELEVRIVATAA